MLSRTLHFRPTLYHELAKFPFRFGASRYRARAPICDVDTISRKRKCPVGFVSVCGREPLREPQCHPRDRSVRASSEPSRVRDEENRDVSRERFARGTRKKKRQKATRVRCEMERKREEKKQKRSREEGTRWRTLFERSTAYFMGSLLGHIVVLFPII